MTETASLVIKVDSSNAKRATADLDGLSRQAARTEGSVSKMGKAFGIALGTIAAGTAIAGLNAIIKNTIEAERVQAQLAARIKSTAGAAGLSVVELNKMAKGLQGVTSFGDEAIGSAQALLLTFTKIGKETFPDALEAVLNVSTALGTDLNSAAIQVGKALNDPIQGVTALGRAGIQFSDDQKEMIKTLVETGRQAEAQRIVLGELETQMGGAARAARDTLGGALDALKEAFGDLLEGDSGDAGVVGVRDAIESLIATMNDPKVKQGFADMISGLAQIATFAANAIPPLLELMKTQQQAFGFAYRSTGNGRRAPEARDTVQGLAGFVSNLAGGNFREAGASLARGHAGLFGIGQINDFSGVSSIASSERFSGVSSRVLGRSQWTPSEDEDKKKTGSKGSKRKMPNFADEDLAALKKLVEETARADEAFNQLAATLAGPLAEAEYTHKQNLAEIDELAKVAGKSAEERDALKAKEIARYEEERDAIKAQKSDTELLIEDMEFELSLIGLSNIEREKAIALRYADAKATEEQRARIAELAEETERARETAEFYNDTQRDASDALVDFATRSSSAKEAFGDFADSLYERAVQWVADQAMQALFGSLGGGGGGSAGAMGSIFDLFAGAWGFSKGAAFSGGGVTAFANGGVVDGPSMFPMSGGRTGLMGEAGPEAIMPLKKGRDGRLGVSGGGGNVTNITVNVPKSYSFRTADHVAQEVGATQQLVARRNR